MGKWIEEHEQDKKTRCECRNGKSSRKGDGMAQEKIVYRLEQLAQDHELPFFIQYGRHDNDLVQHRHEDFTELTIVLSGEATHVVGEERLPVRKGDVFVIQQDTTHGFEQVHNFRICNIMFQDTFFPLKEWDIGNMAGFHALFYVEPGYSQNHHFVSHLHLEEDSFVQVETMIRRMVREYKNRESGRKTSLLAYFLELVVLLARCYSTQTKEQENHEVMALARTAAWLEQHLQGEISVQMLAERADYSVRHLTRLFQQTYHMSPIEYLNSLRLEQACRLLRDTDLSVVDVAMQCGYRNSSYFHRIFLRQMKVSPGKYRKKWKE